MNQKIPVVYILSNGRSGTTLLDMLLGAHPNVWTLGEAQILPWELLRPRVPCGCGNPVPESEFWKKILDDIPTEVEGYHVGYFRNENQVGKVLRWKLLPDLLRGIASQKWEEAINEYGRKNARYFEVVRQAAEEREGKKIQWLVDASKDPYRLFWLQESGYFDLRVIHIIKDPRAFVHSMTKSEVPDVSSKVVRYTGRWIIENAMMQWLCDMCFEQERVRMQTYESFATKPADVLKEFGTWLNIDYPKHLIHKFRNYDNFAISGNVMRWQDSVDEIRLDESWRTVLSEKYKLFIQLATTPFLGVCGYAEAN